MSYRLFLFVITSVLVSIIAFYPGFMSIDSIIQYDISRTFNFNDWQPPIMSLVWSFLNLIFPDPSGMLFFHLALIWTSSLIFWVYNKEYKYSWFFLVVPVLPWIINLQGVIWKDIGLAYTLLLMVAFSYLKPNKKNVFFVFLLLFYAVNIRLNSIPAVLPIVWLIAYIWLPNKNKLFLTLISVLLVMSALIIGNIVNYKILNAEKTKPFNYVMVDDLVFLSAKKGESLLPGIKISEIQSCSKEEINGTVLVGRVFCLNRFESYEEYKPLEQDLKEIWLKSIQDNPLDYLLFRAASFLYLLKSPNEQSYFIWFSRIDPNEYGFVYKGNLATSFIEAYVKDFGSVFNFTFKPYWWVLISIVLFFISFRIPNTIVVKTLLISSLVYTLTYFPVTPMADIRYVYWSVLSSTIAIILIFIKVVNQNISKSLFIKSLIGYLVIYLFYLMVSSIVKNSIV